MQVTGCRDLDAAGVNNMEGNMKGGVGGKKGYRYSSSGNFLVQLVSFLR